MANNAGLQGFPPPPARVHMIQPTREQLQTLGFIERFWFRVADFVLRFLQPLCILWNRMFMVHFSWMLTGRRVRVHGLEHLEELGKTDCVVFAANHRSFFDFYVIGPILYTRTRLSKHILFPVRAPFFYDRWVGGFVNAIMSAFFMFPPIVRDKSKRSFNGYSLDRMVAELERPGQQLGIHPEGTRGKGDDPYVMLRPQPGIGIILSRSAHTVAVPVFITGLTNNMGEEFRRTWGRNRGQNIIDVWFGPVQRFDELRQKGERLSVQMEIAQEVMTGIQRLADEDKQQRCIEE